MGSYYLGVYVGVPYYRKPPHTLHFLDDQGLASRYLNTRLLARIQSHGLTHSASARGARFSHCLIRGHLWRSGCAAPPKSGVGTGSSMMPQFVGGHLQCDQKTKALAHAHTPSHSYSHTHTHSYTLSLLLSHSHAHAHTHSYTHTTTHPHAHTPTLHNP